MEEQIEKWKAEFGKVYRITMLRQDYIFRPLHMSEYHLVSQSEDPVEKEMIILSRGVLYPKIDLATIPSGVAERLVLYISSITNITEETILQKVQEKRDKLGISDDYLKWKCHIIKALNYKPEEVDAMNLDKFIEALVMTEEVLQAPLISVGSDEAELPPAGPDTDAPEETEILPLKKGEIPKPVLETQAAGTVDELRRVYAEEKKRRVVNG